MDSFNIHNYFKKGKTVVLTLKHGDDEGQCGKVQLHLTQSCLTGRYQTKCINFIVRQWSDKSITDLLKLMKAFHSEFQNLNRRKKDVWEDVSNALVKSGYSWTPEDCRKKWSNMIRTFKAIEEQKQDNNHAQSKRFKWPFYDVMLQLLTLENSDSFPEAASVVQMLNSSAASSSNGSISRKNKFSLLQSHNIPIGGNMGGSSQFVNSQRERMDSINLVSDTDLMDIGVSLAGHHETIVPDVQASSNGMESSIIFTQPTGLKSSEDINVIVPSSSSTFSPVNTSNTSRTSLAVKTKKRLSKGKRSGKDNKADESIESILMKFIDTTTNQNEQMLEKMTSFHDNALAKMQERNDILRDIRDSLRDDDSGSQNESCHSHDHEHDDLDEDEDQQNSMTLHIGPAFSINPSCVQNVSNVNAQLNSTLVLPSTSNHSSGLSTFQLEDGTMLSSIDGTHDKEILNSLGSFTQSSLPDDDNEDDVSLLPSSLVSVVDENSVNSSDTQ